METRCLGRLRGRPLRRVAVHVSHQAGPVCIIRTKPPILCEKVGEEPVTEARCVDLLYLACNRLEFTQETFATLLVNTDWHYVRELFVCDDGSVDGTRQWLDKNAPSAPVPLRMLHTSFGSPVTA